MAAITKQELEDAAVDAQSLEDIINGDADRPNSGQPSGTVTTRLGKVVLTISALMRQFASGWLATGTWGALNSMSTFAMRSGTGAKVYDTGTATHVDPVTGATVLDRGVYSLVAGTGAGKGWQRVGDLEVDQIAGFSYLWATARRLGPENGAPALRFRVGNREFGRFDAANGLLIRKGKLGQAVAVDDVAGGMLSSRLFGGQVGNWFKRAPVEAFATAGFRWRIGNRLFATLTPARGFYPRKATLPATAVIDDDLASAITTRLLANGLAGFFKRIGPEAGGGIVRFRWGNRLLAYYSKSSGWVFSRMTLPADVKVADLPGVNLVDRLGSSVSNPFAENATYVATSFPDTSGKRQVRSHRKSDGRQFNGLTSGTSENLVLWLTTGSAIVYWAVGLGRQMWVPAEGGASWRVWPDTMNIDAWGDSIPAGAGAVGSGAGQGSCVKQLADRMGSNVTAINNRGVGGQILDDILARLGAVPATISVTGNQIPASGAVTVTAYSTDLLFNSGTSGSLSLTGTVSGVPGTLSGNATAGRNTATYTFTRTTAGTATACPANTPFIPDLGLLTQDRVALLEGGRNDSWSSPSGLTAKMTSARTYLKTLYPRSLVMAVLASSTEMGTTAQTQIAAVNTAYANAFGDDYVDWNSPPTAEEMATLGFVPDSYGVYSNFHTDAGDLAGKASGGFTLTANPAANDTVTIAGSTIAFVASGASGAQVNIGANAAATAANLATYVNANSGLGVTAVGGTTAAGTVLITLVAISGGTNGNQIAISRSSSALTPSGSNLSGGSTVGVIPSGMRSGATTGNGDWLHPNNFGHGLLALRPYRKLYAKGWYPALALV